jgi:hypothetical protein
MRFFLALALAFALAAPASAQTTFSSVTIDDNELASRATRGFSRVAAVGVEQGLMRVLAGRVGKKGAPRLVVRLKSVMMTSEFGSSRRERVFGNERGRAGDFLEQFNSRFDEPIGNDTLVGEALVVSPKGKVLRRVPMFNALQPNRWERPPNDQRNRITRLGRDFGYWLARKF